MKKEIIFVLILSVISSVLVLGSLKEQATDLVRSNVEALTEYEWGGGYPLPGGGIEWYEYTRTTYEHKYCYHPYLPYYVCECVVTTCQGRGNLFCNGSISCY